MAYFNSRDIAAITLCADIWAVLNAVVSPVFFQLTLLPFMCDLIGFASLILALWWTRKFGTATATGLIVTVLNFAFNPKATFFFGFTAASIVFDILAKLIGYKNCFDKPSITPLSLLVLSIVSAAVAGSIIGLFFMEPQILAARGGVIVWAGLHAVGGFIGGAIGSVVVGGLRARGIFPTKISE